MIDPKKLELATYTSLVNYHLITAKKLDEYVMTTPENSMAILKSAITEMERRFQVFADAKWLLFAIVVLLALLAGIGIWQKVELWKMPLW